MKKKLGRILSLTLALVFAFGTVHFAAFAADVVDSGECGSFMTWTLDAAGTLTVSGTGDMEASSRWTQEHRLDIKKVIIEKGVESIASHAFYDCAELKEVTIPDGMKSIGRYAFYRCVSLQSVKIPDSVTWIGDYTFLGCESMTELKLPAGITVISDYSFDDCPKLTDLRIPARVTDVGNDAFYDCDRLTGVAFPDGVTIIWINAFGSCDGLRQILIPKSVKEIKLYAFTKCEKLSDVYYAGSEEEWNNIMIDQSNTELLNAAIHYNWTGDLPELPLPVDEPQQGIGSKDEEKAVVNENTKQIAILPGLSPDELKDLLGGNADVLGADGRELDAKKKVGTGAIVKAADGAAYTVIVPGDTDGDGKATAGDARKALRASAKLDALDGAFSKAADITGDAKVKAGDARSILRIAAKLDGISKGILTAVAAA
ncbi:MAG: leucine-rich repeat protein [Clostridia bacterium]|nr:leucine-rich repeat protein [Clostridia bacterium]